MSHANFILKHAPELQQAIVRRSVRDVVAAKLGAMIAAGVLQVGDDLPSERDLAAALQVSRETIRGGIQGLVAKGLVAVVHGARTKVISNDVGGVVTGLREPQVINTYAIEHIHASRLLVEREVVKDACDQIDADTLLFLEESLKAQEKAMGDPVRFLIIDREFHFAIYRCCSNRVLSDLVSDLYGYMMGHRREAVSQDGAIAASYGDHLAIVDALRQRDGDAVVKAFDVHLDRIYRTTLSILTAAGESGAQGVSPKG